MEGRTRAGEGRGKGEWGRGKRGKLEGNSALVVGGIDAPGFDSLTVTDIIRRPSYRPHYISCLSVCPVRARNSKIKKKS